MAAVNAAGVPVHVFPVSSFRRPHAVVQGIRLARFIRQQRFDLVHSFDPPATVFVTPFARLSRQGKVLSSMRSHRDLNSAGMRRLLRVTDRLVDGIVVNCKSVEAHLQNDEAVPTDLIHRCYNALDLDQFHPRDRARVPEFRGSETVIGTVCSLRPEKGLPVLVDAFARISPGRRDLRLAIVGSGPESDLLKQQVAQTGCSDRVVFVPEATDVARLLRGIDIFVLPSYSEALSNSLMEAMACGCCPVATRVGGNVELVDQDRTGLLFAPGDSAQLSACLNKLLDQPDVAADMARAARDRMEREFSMTASMTRMASIYETILAA